jgi:hypothetical protein
MSEPTGPSIAKRRAAIEERIAGYDVNLREARKLLPLATSDLTDALQRDLEIAKDRIIAALLKEDDISRVRFLQGEHSRVHWVLTMLDHDDLWDRIKGLEQLITEERDFLATIPVPPKRPPEMPDGN